MKWGYNWELGPFETWDALGFAETVDAMKKDGIALPAWIEKMKARGATGFYKRRRQGVGSRARATYVQRAKPIRATRTLADAAQGRARRCSRTTAPRRGTSATASSA